MSAKSESEYESGMQVRIHVILLQHPYLLIVGRQLDFFPFLEKCKCLCKSMNVFRLTYDVSPLNSTGPTSLWIHGER